MDLEDLLSENDSFFGRRRNRESDRKLEEYSSIIRPIENDSFIFSKLSSKIIKEKNFSNLENIISREYNKY